MLPNPGFDFDSFDGASFDTTLPADLSVNNSGYTNDRRHQEWYVCDRCGNYYPREKMVNQNGLNTCKGAGTLQCYDQRGYSANLNELTLPYEERPQPLPFEDEEL